MPTAEQLSRALIYRDAAGEHVTVARELYDRGRYLHANYLAGLSVECMLRGYRMMIDPQFDSRHDLDKLYKIAKFADVVPPSQMEKVDGWLGDVLILWSNEHRFLTLAALRSRWKKRKFYTHVDGDFVKYWTRRLVDSATEIVTIGGARWTVSFKN